MQYLKQSTSAVIKLGPFVDHEDGVTLETGLAAALDNATTGIKISKNGGTLAARHATVTETAYDAHGFYNVTLDATDTNTLGGLSVVYTDPETCLAVWAEFCVVTANVFDTLCGDDAFDVSVDLTGVTVEAADVAVAVWNRLTSALTTVGSIGKRLADYFAGSSGTAPTLDATALQICNNALLMLGNITITSLDDTGKAAVLCNHFYQQVIDATLRAYKWNCATVRDTLTADETAPEFGFAYRYAVPDDCLRVLGMSEDKTRFKVENGYILTDDSEGMVSYIKRIDAADMDKLLIDAASARMASTLAFPLTNSQSVAEAMWKLYQERLDEARTVDASEGSSEQMLNDDWLNARR